jgi:hypothetical protein
MFRYKVINNFISKDLCFKLINDAGIIHDDSFVKIQTNRNFLSSSSIYFNELKEKSSCWKDFTKNINSNNFLIECCNNLKVDPTQFRKVNFFNIQNDNKYFIKFKNIGAKKIQSLSLISILKYFLFKLARQIYRKIKYSKFFNSDCIPVELLYDYSKAENGYYNNIHRDTDSRIIVFLIYLNTIDGEGGNLELYKKIKKSTSDQFEYELIEKIHPEPGKLVIFLNEDDSYHGVSLLKNASSSRHFLYGGFTSLSQNNPFITKKILNTQFNLYD